MDDERREVCLVTCTVDDKYKISSHLSCWFMRYRPGWMMREVRLFTRTVDDKYKISSHLSC